MPPRTSTCQDCGERMAGGQHDCVFALQPDDDSISQPSPPPSPHRSSYNNNHRATRSGGTLFIPYSDVGSPSKRRRTPAARRPAKQTSTPAIPGPFGIGPCTPPIIPPTDSTPATSVHRAPLQARFVNATSTNPSETPEATARVRGDLWCFLRPLSEEQKAPYIYDRIVPENANPSPVPAKTPWIGCILCE